MVLDGSSRTSANGTEALVGSVEDILASIAWMPCITFAVLMSVCSSRWLIETTLACRSLIANTRVVRSSILVNKCACWLLRSVPVVVMESGIGDDVRRTDLGSLLLLLARDSWIDGGGSPRCLLFGERDGGGSSDTLVDWVVGTDSMSSFTWLVGMVG